MVGLVPAVGKTFILFKNQLELRPPICSIQSTYQVLPYTMYDIRLGYLSVFHTLVQSIYILPCIEFEL
jgi:hypothetical protein